MAKKKPKSNKEANSQPQPHVTQPPRTERDERPLAEKYAHLAALATQAAVYFQEDDYHNVAYSLNGCMKIISGK